MATMAEKSTEEQVEVSPVASPNEYDQLYDHNGDVLLDIAKHSARIGASEDLKLARDGHVSYPWIPELARHFSNR
jgi:hypothetical protein